MNADHALAVLCPQFLGLEKIQVDKNQNYLNIGTLAHGHRFDRSSLPLLANKCTRKLHLISHCIISPQMGTSGFPKNEHKCKCECRHVWHCIAPYLCACECVCLYHCIYSTHITYHYIIVHIMYIPMPIFACIPSHRPANPSMDMWPHGGCP